MRVIHIQRIELLLYPLAALAIVTGCSTHEPFTKRAPVLVDAPTDPAAVTPTVGTAAATTRAATPRRPPPTRPAVRPAAS